MDIVTGGLEAWFAERLQGLPYRPETVAYIAGVLKALGHPRDDADLSSQSVILAYRGAVERSDFAAYQHVGDWVLWTSIIMPARFEGAQQAVEAVGRMSYLACYRIMRGQWIVFEELANALPAISIAARRKLV